MIYVAGRGDWVQYFDDNKWLIVGTGDEEGKWFGYDTNNCDSELLEELDDASCELASPTSGILSVPISAAQHVLGWRGCWRNLALVRFELDPDVLVRRYVERISCFRAPYWQFVTATEDGSLWTKIGRGFVRRWVTVPIRRPDSFDEGSDTPGEEWGITRVAR